MSRPWPFLLCLALFAACIPARPQAGSQVDAKKPRKETTKVSITQSISHDKIIKYRGFTVSFNSDFLIPNWVAYELTAAETDGPYTRKGKDFQMDPSAGVLQADAYDYKGSGWSRGHMAPAGDFKWDDAAMWDTFYYTNCCPQDVNLNNGSWNALENRVRSWARQFGCVSVVTGPIVGQNKGGRIGAHGVLVPDAFFKALLVSTNGTYQGIAFVMFNNSSPQRIQESYLSINELEDLTDIDFFHELEDTTEERVEGTVNLDFWKLK